MEEKERYELAEEDYAYAIVDNESHKTYQNDCFDFSNICDLLNQQDKQIKELEEENKRAKICNYLTDYFLVEKENQQLKQQLKDIEESYNNTMRYLNKTRSELLNLPKKIVEEIRDVAGDYWDFNICEECGNVPDLNTLTTEDFDEILDTILKKYGEENAINND